MYVPIFQDLDACGGTNLQTDTHIHTDTHGTTTVTKISPTLQHKDNHVNKTLIQTSVVIFIGVVMQPEALVVVTLTVSQEQKEFYDKPHVHFKGSSI